MFFDGDEEVFAGRFIHGGEVDVEMEVGFGAEGDFFQGDFFLELFCKAFFDSVLDDFQVGGKAHADDEVFASIEGVEADEEDEGSEEEAHADLGALFGLMGEHLDEVHAGEWEAWQRDAEESCEEEGQDDEEVQSGGDGLSKEH